MGISPCERFIDIVRVIDASLLKPVLTGLISFHLAFLNTVDPRSSSQVYDRMLLTLYEVKILGHGGSPDKQVVWTICVECTSC